jgi:alanyl-tRNA synthetase
VLLSAKPEEITQAVERMLTENAELKREVAALQAEQLETQVKALPENCGNVCRFAENLSSEILRRTALLFAERCGGTAAVFSGSDEKGYRYAAADPKGDVRPLGKELNASFSGRGGGPKELVQGSLSGKRSDLKTFFSTRKFHSINE